MILDESLGLLKALKERSEEKVQNNKVTHQNLKGDLCKTNDFTGFTSR